MLHLLQFGALFWPLYKKACMVDKHWNHTNLVLFWYMLLLAVSHWQLVCWQNGSWQWPIEGNRQKLIHLWNDFDTSGMLDVATLARWYVRTYVCVYVCMYTYVHVCVCWWDAMGVKNGMSIPHYSSTLVQLSSSIKRTFFIGKLITGCVMGVDDHGIA